MSTITDGCSTLEQSSATTDQQSVTLHL